MSNTFKKWQTREISDIDCIRELERENGELTKEFSDERDALYKNLPTGDIKAWDLIIIIKNHISNIDKILR